MRWLLVGLLWVGSAASGTAATLWQGAGAGTSAAEPIEPTAPASAIIHDHLVVWQAKNRDRADRTESLRIELRDQAAVQEFGRLVFIYTPDFERVTLRRLAVVKPDGRTEDLSKVRVEDVTPDGGSLPDQRARLIAVPGLVPGDILEYEVLTSSLRPVVEGSWWTEFTFTRGLVVERQRFEVRAPVSLSMTVQAGPDPAISLDDRTEGAERVWRWERANPVPVLPDGARTDSLEGLLRQPPDIVVSTFSSWDAVAAWYGGVVGRRAQPSPAVRQRAAALVAGATTDRERLEALVTFVGEQVRYLAVPLAARRYDPRPADEVLRSLYGDCKDKFVLLAALGQAVGLEVKPVLMHSTRDLVAGAPSAGQFDHVVSLAFLGDGTEIWADATAGVFPAGVLPPQLRARPALVIDLARARRGQPGSAQLLETPRDTPVSNEVMTELTGALSRDGTIAGTVAQTFAGDSAFLIRLAVRHAGAQIFETMARQITASDQSEPLTAVPGSFEVTGVDPPSNPVRITYRGTRHLKAETLKKAWSFWPPAPPVQFEKVRVKEGEPARVLAITLGAATRTRIRARYELPEGVTATAPAGVTLTHPFAEYASRYEVDGRTVRVERDVRTAAFRVEPEQFAEYEALLEAIQADFRQVFRVTALPVTPETANSAETLHGAGLEAFERGSYARAEELLRAVTVMEPRHVWAWNNLGRALAAQGRHAEAVTAYRRQIEITPADEYAHGNLGQALARQGQLAEAEASLRKHLEIKPLDEWGWRTLGDAILGQHRFADAAAAYERATRTEKPTSRSLFALARAHAFLNQTDRALAAIDRAIELNSGALGYGEAAAELAFLGLAPARVERYVERAFELGAKQLELVTLEDPPERWLSPTLAMALATLGRAQRLYSQTDRTGAEQWLRAAWELYPLTHAGQLLATTYHTSGRTDEARLLAAELAEQNAGSGADTLLSQWEPDPEAREALIARARKAAERANQHRYALAGTGEARVLLSVGPDGRIDEVKFTSGQDTMRATVQGLVGNALPLRMPPGRPVRLIRSASMACDGTECVVTLEPLMPPGFDPAMLR